MLENENERRMNINSCWNLQHMHTKPLNISMCGNLIIKGSFKNSAIYIHGKQKPWSH